MLGFRKDHIRKMRVAEMRMLRWMSGHILRDRIRNEDIRKGLGVANIEKKNERKSFKMVLACAMMGY